MNKTDLVAVRDWKEEDKNFIFASWLRGLYYGDSWFREIPKDIFMHNYHRVIEQILSNPGVIIKVACLKDDPEVILGYAVLSTLVPAVHWVFCKSAWRKIGIANMLVHKNTKFATHMTKVGLSLAQKRGITFNPFLI